MVLLKVHKAFFAAFSETKQLIFLQADWLRDQSAGTKQYSYPFQTRSEAVFWLEDRLVIDTKVFSHLENKLPKWVFDIKCWLGPRKHIHMYKTKDS